MARISRRDYAALCGVPYNSVNMAVTRGHVHVDPDKKIDLEHPKNVKFRKRQEKRKKKEQAQKELLGKQEETTTKKAGTGDVKRRSAKDLKESAEYRKWARDKEKALTVKAQREAELKTLQVEKMMGKLIPVDLVHQILKINIQNIFISFENELVNIASIYCDIMAGGDRAKLSAVITEMRENLERIIKDTKENSQKEIEGVIDEYSETRNRGEKG